MVDDIGGITTSALAMAYARARGADVFRLTPKIFECDILIVKNSECLVSVISLL